MLEHQVAEYTDWCVHSKAEEHGKGEGYAKAPHISLLQPSINWDGRHMALSERRKSGE